MNCPVCVKLGNLYPSLACKTLVSGLTVCEKHFEQYNPAQEVAEAKKDKVCPKCSKKYGFGFAGFCSEVCMDARMKEFTK